MTAPARSHLAVICIAFAAANALAGPTAQATPQVGAEPSVQNQLTDLEDRLTTVEERAAAAGAVLFLFGAFCALWAQNTGRSAWLWFFLGLLFNVIAVLVLLSKNARDRPASGL